MAKRQKDASVVGSGVQEDQWRKVHPITPLARAWALLAALVAFITWQNAELLKEIADSGAIQFFGLSRVLAVVAGGIVVVTLIALVFSWVTWRKMSYAITDEAVYYREGILNRTQRHARLSRIQAVNISFPLIGRIFNLGNIDIEVAGGANSNFKFGLLKGDELETIRREIMLKSAGAKKQAASHSRTAQPMQGGQPDSPIQATDPGSLGQTAAGRTPEQATAHGSPATAPGSPVQVSAADLPAQVMPQDQSHLGQDAWLPQEQLLYRVPAGRLFASVVMNMGVLLSLLFGMTLVGLSIVSMLIWGAGFAAMLPVLVTALAVLGFSWQEISSNFGFSAYITEDGIRVKSGLTSTRAQTISPEKIHGVVVKQPFFWRFFGWYRVRIIQAGFVAGQEDKVDHSILLPVGTREEMLRALWMVYPDLGVPHPVETIMFGIEGQGSWYGGFQTPDSAWRGFSENPQRSRLFDPLVWKRRAISLTDVGVLTRDGAITRVFGVIPYGRLQSVRMQQGPWDRARQLVNLDLHLVSRESGTYISHLDQEQGVAIMAEINQRALENRAKESPQEWVARTQEVVGQNTGRPYDNTMTP